MENDIITTCKLPLTKHHKYRMSTLFRIQELRCLQLISSLWLTGERVMGSLPLSEYSQLCSLGHPGTDLISQSLNDWVNTSWCCLGETEIQIMRWIEASVVSVSNSPWVRIPTVTHCASFYFNPNEGTKFLTSVRVMSIMKDTVVGLKSVSLLTVIVCFCIKSFSKLSYPTCKKNIL